MQLTAEQHKKRIQIDQVIKFRNRDQSSSQKQHRVEEEIENSNVHLQDESMLKNVKKNLPLPQLNREKRKLKMYDPKPSTTPVYLEKEVALRDNLILKNNNNALLTENKKMKTRLVNLQKELQKYQKAPQGTQRPQESISVRTLIKNLKKELQESKKEMARLKTSTKFTSIKELEIEKVQIKEQSKRLRQMLEAEQQQTAILRRNQNQHLQMQVKRLQQKCVQLQRDQKMRKKRSQKSSFLRLQSKTPMADVDVVKQLESARKIIKSKEEEIVFLKKQIKKANNIMIIGDFSSEKNMKLGEQRQKSQTPNLRINTKRQMKSAPKNRHNVSNDMENCSSCKRMKEQADGLRLQIQDLKQELQKLKVERPSIIEDLITHPITKPTQDQAQKLKRFIVYRLKAHGISLQQAVCYLLNVKSFSPATDTISLVEIFETASIQPFSLIIDRYIQAFLCIVFVGQENLNTNNFKLEAGLKKTKQEVKELFQRFIGPFSLDSKQQEERLFIQISQIVTNRAQEISKVLTIEKNAQDTISQQHFRAAFQKLGVTENLIAFMISQIILQSLSLQFLKVDNLFEIFYLVQQGYPQERVERIEIAPIEEEQAEDEQSRSFFEPKKQSFLLKQEQQSPASNQHLPEQEVEYEVQKFEQEQQKQQAQPKKQIQNPVESSQRKEVQIENIDENYEDYFDS